MLKNNQTKDIIKVIKSIENRGILLKETAGNIISQEGRLPNFLGLLTEVGLPLWKIYPHR